MKFISLWTLLVFVGTELQSSDISASKLSKHAYPALVDLLKVSFTQSNFSMAFPCISASEKDAMESSLVSGMSEICGQNFGFSNVCFLESCSMFVSDLHSVHDYILSRMEKRPNGEADLVVFCHKGSDSKKELEPPHSESKKFSEMVSFVDQSGAKYAVLYVSDPIKSIQYPSH
ncbi:hypothetical protein RchiOBHm_Chr7g0192441 [Rosa chinensis]|uniref:Uncharacterized protein n=1 Tax=Rosa chinensis TaxID=74649 RepID=A0A2P6P5I5_ROSCH|nr:uncharacterized protein LOC121050599 [Rosa chinensis]PRQ17201.1 hypothetical protein RchiOBHm_Chr7g0192441 [Rosa chinensis]